MLSQNCTKRNRFIKLLLCLGLIFAGSSQLLPGFQAAVNAAAEEGRSDNPAPAGLRKFAEEASALLAGSEPFTAWAGAAMVIEPLGPGTRSWLITLTKGQGKAIQPLGYMIISATPDGEYKLIEYGCGAESLYGSGALHSGLSGLGLSKGSKSASGITPVYGGPVLAAWMISSQAGKAGKVRFLDALTGELLPESRESWARQSAKYTPPASAVGSAKQGWTPGKAIRLADPFDPYDNLLWITGKDKIHLNTGNLENAFAQQRRFVFAATGPKRTYSVPLPVIGYQIWSPSPPSSGSAAAYMLTGTEDSPRWIALDALLASGSFLAMPD
ncbi:hypothetical protein [Paenibacillus sanfengchensis]|uniref:hypothetical protein n=1 Tax=Paenibacillus sanfengchensis TaxID=3119819 RepID=UPI002FE3611E